jgi:PASTA domain
VYGPSLPPSPSGVKPGIVAFVAAGCLLFGAVGGCAVGVSMGDDSEPRRPEPAVPAAREVPAERPPHAWRPERPKSSVAIPNVVGRDHQEGQNLLQRAGFSNLAEQDATGRGRLLVFDRNWVIVRQHPAAGTRVSPDVRVTLYSKKANE